MEVSQADLDDMLQDYRRGEVRGNKVSMISPWFISRLLASRVGLG